MYVSKNATKQENANTGDWNALPLVDSAQVWNEEVAEWGKGAAYTDCHMKHGDVDNFDCTTSSTMDSVSLYYIPIYAMTFQYNGKTYGVYVEAYSGKYFTDLPVDAEYTFTISSLNSERLSQIKNKNPFGCLGIFIAALIFAVGSNGGGPGFKTWILSIAALLFGNLYTEDRRIIINSFICTFVFLITLGITALIGASAEWKFFAPVAITSIVACILWDKVKNENEAMNSATNSQFDSQINDINDQRKRRRRGLLDSI